jgi:predicted pyridoxine 5'-phosphate oxidase superfamily flavin-nucleotide-binding protein
MPGLYSESSRKLQRRFDTVRLADRLKQLKVTDRFDAKDVAFVESLDMFFLATVDRNGRPNCSYKGGAPGFVRVVDDHTLAFPSYDGNGMFLSMGNLMDTAEVGMLFIGFAERRRLRVNGSASIDLDDPLHAVYPEAQLVVRVRAREIFPNCPRYVHQYQLVDPSKFVPDEACETPVPAWKRRDWAVDVLPIDDPAHDPAREAIER